MSVPSYAAAVVIVGPLLIATAILVFIFTRRAR